jgi:large subunit ribosomal protein L32e
MASIKELLEIRSMMKKKRPEFIRQDLHKKKRLNKRWRKPRGVDSKIRIGFRGKLKKTSHGYRSPSAVRFLHHSGLKIFLAKSPSELDNLNAKENCIVLASSVGMNKKLVILRKAKELGFNVVNIKNTDEFIKKAEDEMNSRKEKKQQKNKVQKEASTKKKEDKLTDKISEEEKKEAEKKEKDKVLTKKDK